ncbi:MAG: hypothetical protein WA484_02590, partial [Solirubrobacteraceae bacterium]
SRHDIAFAASAAALAALTLGARLGGVGGFDAYPRIGAGSTAQALLLGALSSVAVLLPFVDRRGIEP